MPAKHVVTVIEMLGHREHALLAIEPDPKVAGRIGTYWSPELQILLDRVIEPEGYSGPPHDMTVSFRPYRPSRETLVPELRTELRAQWEENRAANDEAAG